jgi:hypothetical protein
MSEPQTRLSITLVLAALYLTPVGSSRAVPGDEHWDAQFGAPRVTSITYAVAVNNGIVYAAGVASGSRTNAPLSAWDGANRNNMLVFPSDRTSTPYRRRFYRALLGP